MRDSNIRIVSPGAYEPISQDKIDQIKPGTFVKINTNNEYYWVKVTSFTGKSIHGTVHNTTIQPGNPPFGKKVALDVSEVFDVYTGEPL